MIGLLSAIIIFNFIALKLNKLTANQTLHIWMFTIAFQSVFDVMVEFKYKGYWYFTKEPNWAGILPHTILIPPVNVLFLSFFPFKKRRIVQFVYIFLWTIAIVAYEALTLLPEPWGYFNSGWWKLWHSAIVDPILFLILLAFFRYVKKVE